MGRKGWGNPGYMSLVLNIYYKEHKYAYVEEEPKGSKQAN